MKSINHVSLLGHLAADPELRETASGKKIASFSLATNTKWTAKNGEHQENTDFHRITAWDRLAEICKEYLKKGSAVFVSGRLQNRSFEGQDGKMKYFTDVVANDLSILSWKKAEKGNEIDIKNVQADEEAVAA